MHEHVSDYTGSTSSCHVACSLFNKHLVATWFGKDIFLYNMCPRCRAISTIAPAEQLRSSEAINGAEPCIRWCAMCSA